MIRLALSSVPAPHPLERSSLTAQAHSLALPCACGHTPRRCYPKTACTKPGRDSKATSGSMLPVPSPGPGPGPGPRPPPPPKPAPPTPPYPFQDPKLDWAARIANLVSVLTLGEKVSLLQT